MKANDGAPHGAWMGKQALPVELAAAAAMLPEVFERLSTAGSARSCLFGAAAARDADLGALWGVRESLYAIDRKDRAIGHYPGQDPRRLEAYRERMRAKFPRIPERCPLSPAERGA